MKPIEYLVTGEEMQCYDANTISHFKVPAFILMEQAAMAAAEEIINLFPSRNKKILILSGKGNNGGDAMAVARLLHQKGYPVTVFTEIIPGIGTITDNENSYRITFLM